MTDRLVRALEELRAACVEVSGHPPTVICFAQGVWRNRIEEALLAWKRGHPKQYTASLIDDDDAGRVTINGVGFRVRFD